MSDQNSSSQPSVNGADNTVKGPMPLIIGRLIALFVHEANNHLATLSESAGLGDVWRPTPLLRARRLERALGTPPRISITSTRARPLPEAINPNTSVAQAFYNKAEGVKALTTETGAGQWGSSLAFAGKLFGIDIEVYMVKVSYTQKPYRRIFMETFGAKVFPSPSNQTNYGRSILAVNPDNPGSLGIAISEAVEVAATSGGTKKYSLGSVLGFVCLHQTVIGEEAVLQMEMADEYPDVNWPSVALLLCGSIPGVWLGSQFHGKIHRAIPEGAIALALFAMGVRIIIN